MIRPEHLSCPGICWQVLNSSGAETIQGKDNIRSVVSTNKRSQAGGIQSLFITKVSGKQ